MVFFLSLMQLTKSEFRKAMGQFATGVTVLTVMREPGEIPIPAENQASDALPGEIRGLVHGPIHGMTANSFSSVSLNPLLVLVCVAERAQTLPLIHQHKQFGINFLANHQQPLAEYFSNPVQSAQDAARLGVTFRYSKRGTPLLAGSMVQLDCALVSSHVAGDHTIFIAGVDSAEVRPCAPLLFFAGKYCELPSASS